MVRSKRLRSCVITTLQDDEAQSNGDDLSPTLDPTSSEIQPTLESEPSENNLQGQEPTNVEENDTLEIIDEQGNSKKKRGVTRAKDVWNLPYGERIKVEWTNFGQPIKKAGGILGGWLGTVARRGNMCPIHYLSWKDMPAAPFKINIIRMTQSKFVLPRDDKVEAWVLKSNLSRIGKASRANHTTPHTTGSKSFARKRHEFVEQNDRDPGRIEFFLITHKTKDGEYINKESNDFAEDLLGDLAKQASTSDFSNGTKEIEDSILKEKKGEDRYGRVRGYGIQAQLRNVENERHDPMKEEVQKLQAQMQEMQKKHELEMKKHESEMNEIKSLLHRLVGQSGNLGIETRESPSV